jgi:hypothetical protein
VRELADFHHFREDEIPAGDRVARCELWVVRTLLESELADEQRESSRAFELKHHHSVGQFARLLARKRGLPVESCTVGALLHDIYVIQEGKYADHAHLGAPLALAAMEAVGGFSADEKSVVERIVYHHSDKHFWSDDPFAEFGKDVDVLDCFLYPGAFGYYLRHKRLPVFAHYLRRATQVWEELGIPADPGFRILECYGPGWLGESRTSGREEAGALVSAMLSAGRTAASPFFLRSMDDAVTIAVQPQLRGVLAGIPSPGNSFRREADELIATSERHAAGLLVFPPLDSFEIVADGSERFDDLGLPDSA